MPGGADAHRSGPRRTVGGLSTCRPVVAQLSAAGMSTRQIAPVVGVAVLAGGWCGGSVYCARYAG